MRGTTSQTPRTTKAAKRRDLMLERLSGLRRGRARAGFTIVELLIVVVVLAILAAIVLVSYNGITNQANDSARLADASTIEKALQLHQVEHGSSIGTQNYPESREEMLGIYQLEGVANRTVVVDIDTIDTSNFDQSKVYMRVSLYCGGEYGGSTCSTPLIVEQVNYAFWSNADDVWRNVRHSSSGFDSGVWEVSEYETSSENGPLSLGVSGPL